MMSVITNAIQPLETLEDGGRILMVKDEEGNYIPEWQRLMVEGYTRTVLRRMKELAAVRSFKDMQKLQPHEVYNFSKIATSVVMYLGMMLLYGFTVDDDRKKKGIHASNKIDEFRLIRNWKYVYNSIFVMGNITEVIKSPFAAGNIISDMFYDVTGKFNPLHKYPLAGTIKTFDEVFTGKTQRQQAYEERNEDNNNN
jgi:hypothetical protein